MAYYFPEEILTEILKRIPVKSLVRFSCVKKSWYCLIHTPLFKTLHSKSNHQKYLLIEYTDKFVPRFSLCFDDNDGCQEYYSPKLLPGMLEQPSWSAISNGLVCLSTARNSYCIHDYYYSDIQIWNPAIRKFITLPDPPRSSPQDFYDCGQVHLAFGFVHNDYKVVKLLYDRSRLLPLVDVFTLSSNSWKIISQDNLFRIYHVEYYKKEVFVNGAAYWIGRIIENNKQEYVILCFDTKKEVMKKILLPECCKRDDYISIRALGESLALLSEKSSIAFKIWVWEEASGDYEGFWKPNITVNLEGNFYSKVIGLRNNGDLVIQRNFSESGVLVCYNVQKNEITDFDVSDIWSIDSSWCTVNGTVVNPFTESLFLPWTKKLEYRWQASLQ